MTGYLPKRQDSDNKPDERCDIRLGVHLLMTVGLIS